MTSTNIITSPLVLSKDEGIHDLWWPYGPDVGRYTVKTTAAQTQGSLVQMLARDSRGAATPMHIHHDYDETWYVIEGEIAVFIGDERFTATAGDFVLGPRGIPHAWVVTSETVEVLITCGPAGVEGPSGQGLDAFFREVAVPVGEGAKPQPTMPADPADFARRMMTYNIELVGPPPAL
jgi:quercetin dioxygenase-like cupin family protein